MLERMDLDDPASHALFDAVVRRLYEAREVRSSEIVRHDTVLSGGFEVAGLDGGWQPDRGGRSFGQRRPALDRVLTTASSAVSGDDAEALPIVDLVLQDAPDSDDWLERVTRYLKEVQPSRSRIERLGITWFDAAGVQRHRTFLRMRGRLLENAELRDVHAEVARRVGCSAQRVRARARRWSGAHPRVRARAKENAKDERVFVIAEVFGRADAPEGQEDLAALGVREPSTRPPHPSRRAGDADTRNHFFRNRPRSTFGRRSS